MKTSYKNDVIIIGAGPIGLILAQSLAKHGLSVRVIEKQDKSALKSPANDGREIALTRTSKIILESLGVWQAIPQNEIGAIREAKVINGKSPYALHFSGAEGRGDILGHMVSNCTIRKAAFGNLKQFTKIHLMCGRSVSTIQNIGESGTVILDNGQSLSAPLIVAADGRFSMTRQKMGVSARIRDFGRCAIVFCMTVELPHNNIAYECFYEDMTLAILPLAGQKVSVVMTIPPESVEGMMSKNPAVLAMEICQKFNNRLGGMKLNGGLFSYPLVSVFADTFYKKRLALVGDAAVGMHPVTAYGFNFGLQGQRSLAEEVARSARSGGDIGSDIVLARYDRLHRQSTRPLYLATNAIVSLYSRTDSVSRILRPSLLRLGNHFPFAKRVITRSLSDDGAGFL